MKRKPYCLFPCADTDAFDQLKPPTRSIKDQRS